jgi:periplasmic protein TonB
MAEKGAQRRLASRIAGAFIAILLIVGFIWFVNAMMSLKTSKPPRVVQTVQIIRPPPPPPPDQPPPPPVKTQEPLPKDVPEPTPEQQPDQAPEQPLGVDAEGSAGGDAFGLAARHGGSDLIGGTGTAPFAWYTNRMRDAIKERLTAAPCTKSAKGTVSTRVLVGADGRVKQIKLMTTTGNAKVDECVDKVLGSITALGDAPPPGMPEQVNLRVVF